MTYRKALRIFSAFMAFLIALLICTNLITGCSRKPEKSSPRNTESQKKESQALNKLQTSIDSIVKEYEKVYLMQTAPPPKAPESEKEQQSDKQSQDKEQQQKSDSENQKSKKEDIEQGQQQSSQNKNQNQMTTQPDWPKLEQSIADIHKQWNGFQTEAVKNGATSEMISDFSNTLNHLTMTLTRQALYEGLLAANDLYGKTVDFEKLFKTKSPPEARKVIYYGRMAVYKILNNDEIGASEAMNKALSSWESVKSHLEDPNEVAKVQFSLDELSQAILERDPNLIKIKAQIAESNVHDAIKLMEESKKEE